MMRASPRLPALFAFALLSIAMVVLPGTALADPPRPDANPATAQALFYEGRALAREGRYALACAKFEESLRLDYGIGTEFNLADCNEKLGKLATAWAGFLKVAAASRARGQAERERIARERAKALEDRVPKLTIEVAASATPNLEVKRDGFVVGSSSWGAPMPVDPGPHRITASAPGYVTWEGVANAVEGKVVHVTVPWLAPAPPPTATPPPASTAPVASPAEAAHAEGALPVPPPPPFPAPVIERTSGQRVAGWILAGAGLAGIGVGAGFGIDSLRKREHAEDHCEGRLCDDEGVALRDAAIASGNVATVATVVGGAAVVGGLVLVLTAPRSAPPPSPTSGSRLRAHPLVAKNGGGLTLEGVLP